MSTSGQPMLTDFGLSRALECSLAIQKSSATGEMKGTIRFMAYELVKEDSSGFICTEASDMWAFGMVIYVTVVFVAYTTYQADNYFALGNHLRKFALQ